LYQECKNNGLNKREVSPVIAENLMAKILTRVSKNLDGVMLWQDF
jgi:amidophosphoribosyltransferase